MLPSAPAARVALDAAGDRAGDSRRVKQALITGATGFVGGRLAEVAFERGVEFVALVRAWSRATRLARLPIRMISGNVLDLDSLREAMQGCDVVFHCAVDNRAGREDHRRSSVQGTANVMQAALELGVKRVVHLSSVAVYSYQPGSDAATEEGAYRYSGDAYCDGKIDGEKVALRYYREHGLPVTVLRPTVVYGPFGSLSTETTTAVRQGRLVLIKGGSGICNTLYVDNLIQAMLLAAVCDNAAGEILHISDARPVTWKEFIEAHARALGNSCLPLPEMTIREIRAAREEQRKQASSWQQIRRLMRDPQTEKTLRSIPIVRRVVGLALPQPIRRGLSRRLSGEKVNGAPKRAVQTRSRPLPSRDEVDIQNSNIVFSIEKARRILGYDPRIAFAEGMERTAAWIKWARL